MSLDLPSDAGASPPARRPYLFHPTAGEAYPSRSQVFSSGRMSARASWPHNLPFCLYLSNTASLDLPLDAGESLPARQPYLSNLLLDEAYPSDTAILNHSRTLTRASRTNSLNFSNLLLDEAYPSDMAVLKPQSDVGESLPDRQTFLFHPAAGKAYPTTLPLTARPSDPLNFALLSKPIRLGEPRSPYGRRREHSRPDNLIFPSPRSTRLTSPTRQVLCPRWASARASQRDDLPLPPWQRRLTR